MRIVEVILPKLRFEKATHILSSIPEGQLVNAGTFDAGKDTILLRVLAKVEDVEKVIDLLKGQFLGTPEFRIIVLPVQACIPRLEEDPDSSDQADKGWFAQAQLERISREELMHDIERMSRITPAFCALVVLSTIVAAVGLIKHNIPVLVGAMVIAPLLGPNIALAFGTTIGDWKLITKALKINLLGSITAFCLSVLIGLAMGDTAEIQLLAQRMQVGVADIVLALASGSAGVLALTGGASSALVGVMVAVALLPPLVSFGILLSSGHQAAALTAILILAINVISVNLSAVAMFAIQKITPFNWWEHQRATSYRLRSMSISVLLLIILSALLYFNF